MFKKILFPIVGFFLIPFFAHASIRVSEIMYDAPGTDTDHEWIELENTGSESVDIAGWKLFEANSNHGLTAVSGTDIPAGGFVIIADSASQFQSDYPSVSVPIFDSSFSLNNSGETISIKDSSLSVVDTVSYTNSDAAGDGNTLIGSGSSWLASSATPGAANSGSSSSDDSTPPAEEEKQEVKAQPMKAEIISIKSGITHIEIKFTPKVTGPYGENLDYGKVYWNFGDGTQKELLHAEPVFHTYTRPGKYSVLFEYDRNPYLPAGEVSTRTTITIVNAPILFADLGTAVSLRNTGSTDQDMSGWIISSGSESFIIPHGTIILSGAELILEKSDIHLPSGVVTSFYFPNGTPNSIATPASLAPPVVRRVSTASSRGSLSPSVTLAAAASQEETTPILSDETETEDTAKNKSPLFAIIGFGILIIGGGVILYRFRKNKTHTEADEYDIIDEYEDE